MKKARLQHFVQRVPNVLAGIEAAAAAAKAKAVAEVQARVRLPLPLVIAPAIVISTGRMLTRQRCGVGSPCLPWMPVADILGK